MRARIPITTVMMKPPKMRRDERRREGSEEKSVRRRNEGARQSAHYELATFRYCPRRTEKPTERRQSRPAEQPVLLVW